jgi:hypothetical protein|nr:MAG TPA: Flagellar and Swarming motility protein [Caudoviricetes sp.]
MIKNMVMKLTRTNGNPVLVNFDNVLFVEMADDGEVGSVIRFNVPSDSSFSVISSRIRVKESLSDIEYKLTT